jgi:FkbM family methyltransferase
VTAPPIVVRDAASWSSRRTGPPESRIVPERRSLRLAFAALEPLPRKLRSYGIAASSRLLSPGEVRLSTQFGTLVSSIHDHTFLRPVFEEPFETALVTRLIRTGTTFVDVGANRGWYSLLAAQLVGPEGRVLSFEPDPAARLKLEKNLAANPTLCERIEVHPYAVAERDGTEHLVREAASSLSHLERAGDEDALREDVQVRRLCSVLSESPLPPVSVVKIDVEGAELRVLRGLLPCLSEVGTPAVLVEAEAVHLVRFGSSIDEILSRLAPSHRCFWVCWRHGRLEEMTGPWCQHSGRNILALPIERAGSMLPSVISDIRPTS